MNMKKTESLTDLKTINWLLEKKNPSVRYFTLTQLLGKKKNEAEVLSAKSAIMDSGIVPEILSKQDEAGFWIAPGRFYTAKYSGTVWQLMILAELGADKENGQIKKGCDFILNHSQDRESYGFAHRSGAKNEGGLHSEVIPCLTGNMVWSLIKLGYTDDSRVLGGVDWICRYQRADDGIDQKPAGWPYDRYQICWGKHSCHMGVVKSLKALSALPAEKRSKVVNDKIEELVEYILLHHIHKQSHNLTKVSRPGWLKLGFPLMYQTDILEILDILTDLGYSDKRMDEAIQVVRNKQNSDGRWVMENSYNGRMQVNIETKGEPSKWITCKALKVLKYS
jgi:hypothetical protein